MRRFVPVGLLVCIAPLLLAPGCGREAPVGTLAVNSEPAGAAVTVDGSLTGRTTPVDLVLPAGRHTVTVALADHVPIPPRRELTVAPAQRVTAGFTLVGQGRLAVISAPPAAAIVLDGETTGTVTPDTLAVAAGPHTVLATLPGRVAREGEQQVDVPTGGLTAVAFTLVPAGTLRVRSEPVSAAVAIDGAASGHDTPADLVLSAGLHTVRVLRTGWLADPESLLVDVPAGGDTTVTFHLAETGQTGTLAVTSAPPGAAVLVDGEPTGDVTPAQLDLPAGNHAVAVAHPLFHDVTPVTVTVPAGGAVERDFVLSARRVALVENMSSVNCVGCPQMNALLDSIVVIDGYGPDRLLGIKYSQGWLGPDPHYAANPDDNDARTQYYFDNTSWDGALPTLFLDGRLSVAPDQTNGYPPHDALLAMLVAENGADPGFALQVTVDDFTAPVISATVTVLTAVPPDGTGHWELDVALVESPVHYDTPPGSEGETEFHWIMRDFQRLDGEALTFAPDTPDAHAVSFTGDPGWVPDNLWVIALVQDRVTLQVIQAGSSRSAVAAAPTTLPSHAEVTP